MDAGLSVGSLGSIVDSGVINWRVRPGLLLNTVSGEVNLLGAGSTRCLNEYHTCLGSVGDRYEEVGVLPLPLYIWPHTYTGRCRLVYVRVNALPNLSKSGWVC